MIHEMPLIKSEADLLSAEIRQKVLKHFDTCPNNQARKAEAFKGYECLKDKTHLYVLDLLKKQFDPETVTEMEYAISNISIFRKIIEKLAKVYSNGAKRTMKSEADTKKIEEAAKVLEIDTAMKKANRYFRAFKNTLVQVLPKKVGAEYRIAVSVLPPFHYDVIEHPDNPEEPLAVIISDYTPSRPTLYHKGDPGVRSGKSIEGEVRAYDARPANASEDRREFIWWTNGFHFTTNAKGEIINAPETGDVANPIGELPFVNFAGDQDGCFWAEGGHDLIDTGVKVNVDLTNIKHIGCSQGYGQLYMTGKNLPKAIKVGPNHCVQLEHESEDPTPTIGYLNSNPPLEELKSIVEMQVALMLSTNNLSTSGFSTSLQNSKDFASGIALMIDKSESVEDVNDQAQIFIRKEPHVWAKVAAWLEVYRSRGLLVEEQKKLKLPKDFTALMLAFPAPQPIITESEELDVIQKRKDLGLNTMVELLMRDDPSLTEEQANEKLAKIQEEKKANAAASGMPTPDAEGGMNGNQSKEGDRVAGEDGDNLGVDKGPEDTGSGEDPDQE